MKMLIDKIRENIEAARENQYDLSNYSDEELAGDLIAYAADVEGETFENILAAVKEYRNAQRKCS